MERRAGWRRAERVCVCGRAKHVCVWPGQACVYVAGSSVCVCGRVSPLGGQAPAVHVRSAWAGYARVVRQERPSVRADRSLCQDDARKGRRKGQATTGPSRHLFAAEEGTGRPACRPPAMAEPRQSAPGTTSLFPFLRRGGDVAVLFGAERLRLSRRVAGHGLPHYISATQTVTAPSQR